MLLCMMGAVAAIVLLLSVGLCDAREKVLDSMASTDTAVHDMLGKLSSRALQAQSPKRSWRPAEHCSSQTIPAQSWLWQLLGLKGARPRGDLDATVVAKVHLPQFRAPCSALEGRQHSLSAPRSALPVACARHRLPVAYCQPSDSARYWEEVAAGVEIKVAAAKVQAAAVVDAATRARAAAESARDAAGGQETPAEMQARAHAAEATIAEAVATAGAEKIKTSATRIQFAVAEKFRTPVGGIGKGAPGGPEREVAMAEEDIIKAAEQLQDAEEKAQLAAAAAEKLVAVARSQTQARAKDN
eukprot:gnl/TRDRNA2_/TRDRNA2_176689_c2_seq4.p1 gnl/TRDRNA2_/TRDRNA2_176689_c2~~gnl/TRDRNA2_/TRDRNA2_176689_c2_seq4.p1  ORF type:complete len:300 (-),score=54.45 gnl/TRDRNA2_/TRDRNA2_176689_c2_seq4:11-910(-)